VPEKNQLSFSAVFYSFKLHSLTFKRPITIYNKQSVRTALLTLSTTVIKTNQLMTYTAKAAVCSQIRTKYSVQSEQHVEFFNVKPGGT
jgi:hypothetical protein